MMEPAVVFSTVERDKALAYLVDCLKGSPLVERLGVVFPECGDVTLVTATEPPPGQDFFSGWGSSSCGQWLIEEIVRYQQDTPDSLVLFEDIVSRPSDSYLKNHQHPPFWCYGERVFWPVLPGEANRHSAQQAMAWSAGMRTIAIFSRLPAGFPLPTGTLVLSGEAVEQIASSLSRLVTDVFDGEGFVDWRRRQ
jgi:hypothetical protein